MERNSHVCQLFLYSPCCKQKLKFKVSTAAALEQNDVLFGWAFQISALQQSSDYNCVGPW